MTEHEFLSLPGVTRSPAAAEPALLHLEDRLGAPLPGPARAFYAACDGTTLPGGGCLLSLEEAEHRAEMFDTLGGFEGYLPLTDFDDSDIFCLCTRGPLAGRVVHILHDDSPRLAFRDFGAFLAALAGTLDHPSELRHRLDYEPSRTDPTEADDRDGLELLRLAGRMDPSHPSLTDAQRFATVLLRPHRVAELTRLLEDDEYAREAALERLRALDTPAAREAVSTFERELTAFVARAADELRQGGVGVEAVRGDVIGLAPAGVWLRVALWFGRRGEPEVWDEIVTRARQFLALED